MDAVEEKNQSIHWNPFPVSTGDPYPKWYNVHCLTQSIFVLYRDFLITNYSGGGGAAGGAAAAEEEEEEEEEESVAEAPVGGGGLFGDDEGDGDY